MEAKEYFERGEKYFSEKNFDGAIADFTEVIKLESDNSDAYYMRGLSYTNKKELDLAIADFTEAIRIEPDKFGIYYFCRAGVYDYKGNKDLAISDLEKAVKIDPQNERYREALNDIKSGNSGNSIGGASKESLAKEIKLILVRAIIFAVIGAVLFAIITLSSSYDPDPISIAIMAIVGLWIGFGFGGNLSFLLILFLVGWDVLPFSFGWISDRSESFLSNLGINLLENTFGLFLKLFLALLFACAGLVAIVAAGPIWPLIRISMRRGKIKEMQK